MERRWCRPATIVSSIVALLCWFLAFSAGTDIWHDIGRPDFLRQGATNFDIRAFAYGFYLLPVVLLAQVALALASRRNPRHLH